MLWRLIALSTVILILGGAQNVVAQTIPAPVTQVYMPPQHDAFGGDFQVTWISPSNFAPDAPVAFSLLRNKGDGFYELDPANPIAAGRFSAELSLPAGAEVLAIQCLAFDSADPTNILFGYHKVTFNTVTQTPDTVFTHQFQTTGSTGYQLPLLLVPEADQLIQYEPNFAENLFMYRIDVFMNHLTHAFRGCRALWRRTVSPAPGSATFADVPIGDPQHRFVEALVKAGITAGCGGGNYCPNAPVTRGQMAVFLAAALGLHWPF